MCWSHHCIVSFPSTNSAMAPFSNHLSLKDFMLLDLSSSLLLRIFTYSILFCYSSQPPISLLSGRAGLLSGRLPFHFFISIGARLFLIQLTYTFLLPVYYIFHLCFLV